jgi:hypothetical protein
VSLAYWRIDKPQSTRCGITPSIWSSDFACSIFHSPVVLVAWHELSW